MFLHNTGQIEQRPILSVVSENSKCDKVALFCMSCGMCTVGCVGDKCYFTE